MSSAPVSACTTHLNEWPAVQGFAESILPQMGPRGELVIVDAGSRGPSRAYLESLSSADPRVRLLIMPGCTRGEGRDVAWRSASASAILHCDADRVWRPNGWRRVLELLPALERGPVKLRSPLGQIGLGGFLLRRSQLEAVDGYDPTLQYFEDTDLERRLRRRFELRETEFDVYAYDAKEKMRRIGNNFRYYASMYRDAARIRNGFAWMVRSSRSLSKPWRYPFLAAGYWGYRRGRRMAPARCVAESDGR